LCKTKKNVQLYARIVGQGHCYGHFLWLRPLPCDVGTLYRSIFPLYSLLVMVRVLSRTSILPAKFLAESYLLSFLLPPSTFLLVFVLMLFLHPISLSLCVLLLLVRPPSAMFLPRIVSSPRSCFVSLNLNKRPKQSISAGIKKFVHFFCGFDYPLPAYSR
jgi:hypothetical protein